MNHFYTSSFFLSRISKLCYYFFLDCRNLWPLIFEQRRIGLEKNQMSEYRLVQNGDSYLYAWPYRLGYITLSHKYYALKTIFQSFYSIRDVKEKKHQKSRWNGGRMRIEMPEKTYYCTRGWFFSPVFCQSYLFPFHF